MWYSRLLTPPPDRSFFLFGPRGVGKSSWLKKNFPDAVLIDLLKSETYLKLSHNPSLLESLAGDDKRRWIIVDEIQKIPALLDEAHRLIEDKRLKFILTGSSARKLKGGGGNLLGGRALTRHMEGLSFQELGKAFDLKRMLAWGSLPLVHAHPAQTRETLADYVHTYLKEEIRAEGLLRHVEPFVRFLEIAGILNGQELNTTNIARESLVKRHIVETYISILEDTLLAHKLPSYRPRIKVRESAAPKLYWFDTGVARAAAGLLGDDPDATWMGTALECFLFHELRVYNQAFGKFRNICYYRASNNVEIDFIVETRKGVNQKPPNVVCIEVKHANRWKPEWSRHMLNLKNTPGITVEKMFGIHTGAGSEERDGVRIAGVTEFLKALFKGDVF